jgi:uncharacterized protein YggE
MLTAAQDKSVVRASADAVVQVAPDRARVDVGVVSQAQTAQAAGEENARRVQQVMAELRKLVGPKAEIKTLYYSVQPNYRTPRPGGSPEIAGYTASNTVQVTLDDLSLVGKVIDGAMRSGANNIHGVQFSIRDEKPARAQALAQAAQIARAEAEAIAKALGLRVIRVHGAEEGERQPVFPMQTRMAMAEAAQTPIEPGAIDVRGSVTVTLEVQP